MNLEIWFWRSAVDDSYSWIEIAYWSWLDRTKEFVACGNQKSNQSNACVQPKFNDWNKLLRHQHHRPLLHFAYITSDQPVRFGAQTLTLVFGADPSFVSLSRYSRLDRSICERVSLAFWLYLDKFTMSRMQFTETRKAPAPPSLNNSIVKSAISLPTSNPIWQTYGGLNTIVKQGWASVKEDGIKSWIWYEIHDGRKELLSTFCPAHVFQ